jgi:hypothetical protein
LENEILFNNTRNEISSHRKMWRKHKNISISGRNQCGRVPTAQFHLKIKTI